MDDGRLRRLAIICFYDFEGVVDLYFEKLVQSICETVAERVIVVSNGALSASEIAKIKKYGTELYIRKNNGFDGGAYQEIILDYLKDENWILWDEVLLMNDTFYGPLFSWEEMIARMESERADFWGVTRDIGAEWEGGFLPGHHIDSYFLMCRKELICADEWIEFWKTLPELRSLTDAIIHFESRFTQYFESKGFIGRAYMDYMLPGGTVHFGESIWMYQPYIIIKEGRAPILKRKALSLLRYKEAVRALMYVNEETEYDLNYIMENLKRLEKGKQMISVVFDRMLIFCKMHCRIFIYGNGQYGKAVVAYLDDHQIQWENILVSKTENEEEEKIREFDEVTFQSGDGIILALGKENTGDVLPIVSRRFDPTHILLLQ